MRRTAGALAVVLLCAGCAAPGPGLDDRREIGDLVVGWSEADDDAVVDIDARKPRLLTSDADRDAFLDALPEAFTLDTAPVEEADLDEVALLIASYGQCTEVSQLVVDENDRTVRLRIAVEPDTVCGWMPQQVEVWSVDRDDLDGEPAAGRSYVVDVLDDGRYRCSNPAPC
ncbi:MULTISPECIES: hypothetical protein [unclassified Actinotalea]|uniref:hypothetical protein n=1 Tax=unclassified Actinotalea TaxID=2638618 RepID=UPI0015F392B9|nr:MULTISPECIES: hypothetical protein [unclassified Actinotalea]